MSASPSSASPTWGWNRGWRSENLGEIVSTGTRRSSGQLARDRRRISNLYLCGRLQVDIAEEVGLSVSTVCRDIKALHRDWLKSALVDFDKAKARELAKIDDLERTYHAAWKRSCEDAETTTQKMISAGANPKAKDEKGKEPVGRKEMTKTAKGQAGDPRFLHGILQCIDRRCKILGVDAPQRIEATGKDGEPLFDLAEWERKRQERRDGLLAPG